jgi:hypothetical protein
MAYQMNCHVFCILRLTIVNWAIGVPIFAGSHASGESVWNRGDLLHDYIIKNTAGKLEV